MPPGSAIDTAPFEAIRRSRDADGSIPRPGKRDGNAEGLPGHRGEGNPAQGRLPLDMPGLGAAEPVGLQCAPPQRCACPGETKDTAAQGELNLPLRAGSAGKPRVPENETGRTFRIVPRAVGGDGELRFPLPDDASHVRNPRSRRRRSTPRYPVPPTPSRRQSASACRANRRGEVRWSPVPPSTSGREELPPCRKDPPRPTETATLRRRPPAARRRPPPVQGTR